MSTETKNVLLYGKLQDGLRIDLFSKAPAILGTQNYQELYMAARNKEKCLAKLKRKRQYAQGTSGQFQPDKSQQQPSVIKKEDQQGKVIFRKQVKCYTCGSPNHLAHDCQVPTTESRAKTRMAKTDTECDKLNDFPEIAEYLFPSSISLLASMSVIQSEVTTPKCIEVQIEGVPIRGIVDTSSDITIITGPAFREIVNISKVPKRKQFKPAKRKAYTYGHHPLSLDGQIDLHIKFGKKCICETVYIKLDAPDTLLLSENVCCKLDIASYHPDVQPVDQGRPKGKKKKTKIKLIQTVRLPTGSSAVLQVKVKEPAGTDLMLELDKFWQDILLVKDCLLKSKSSASVPIIMTNTSLSTQVLKRGTYLGKAATIDLIHADANVDRVDIEESEQELSALQNQTHPNKRVCWRKQELKKQLQSFFTTSAVSNKRCRSFMTP